VILLRKVLLELWVWGLPDAVLKNHGKFDCGEQAYTVLDRSFSLLLSD